MTNRRVARLARTWQPSPSINNFQGWSSGALSQRSRTTARRHRYDRIAAMSTRPRRRDSAMCRERLPSCRSAAQPGVIEVTSARLRWIGHRIEAEAHVTVDQDLTTLASHAIAESVRHAIFHDVPRISNVTVHVVPCDHAGPDPHQTTIGHLPSTPRPRPCVSTTGDARSH